MIEMTKITETQQASKKKKYMTFRRKNNENKNSKDARKCLEIFDTNRRRTINDSNDSEHRNPKPTKK